MAKYECLVRVLDLPGKRTKEGDIITIRAAGYPWGRVELKRHLIVPIESNKSLIELRHRFTSLNYENEMTEIQTLNARITPKHLGKRRYQLPIDNLRSKFLPELDTEKILGPTIYQPFKKQAGIEKLTKEEVDCGLSSTAEVVPDWTIHSTDLVYDKHIDSYIGEPTHGIE